jgi:hypothetical protein
MGRRVSSDGPAGGIGWACGSGQIGPLVGSDKPGWVVSDAEGPRIGSRRMGPRVASDGPAVGIGWAGGPGRMIQQVASDRPAVSRLMRVTCPGTFFSACLSTARFLKVYQSFVRLPHHSTLADPA